MMPAEGDAGMFTGPGAETEDFTVEFEGTFTPTPENTVTIKIVGIADDATEDAITDKLMEMSGAGSMTWTTVDDALIVEMAPVKDVKAFARKIDFGTVTEVKDKTITVQVAK